MTAAASGVYVSIWRPVYNNFMSERENFCVTPRLVCVHSYHSRHVLCTFIYRSLYGNLPSTLEWDEQVFALSDLLPMLAAAPGVYVSIWRPVYISFMSERESEELERKLQLEAQQEMRSKRRSEMLAKLTLMQLLETEPGFETFKLFLQEEFSVENIRFVVAASTLLNLR